MPLNFSFKKYINPQALVGTLNKLPPLHTLVLDTVYTNQINHPFDTIGYEDLQATCKNIPLITRGSSSYPLALDNNQLKFIDPANLTPSQFVSAADINRIKNLPQQSVQVFVSNRIDRLRRAVRASKEALAIQSLTGSINYDVQTANGGIDKYKITFGTPKSVTISTKWNANGATASGMISDFGKMIAELKKSSNANDFIGFVDFDTFASMVALVNNASTKLPIEVSAEYIVIAGVKVYASAATYYDYSTKTNVALVAAKKLLLVGKDDGFGFYNCALDSVAENFAAMPFAVREISEDDPEGLKLLGMSRPMPVPNVNAICLSTVLS